MRQNISPLFVILYPELRKVAQECGYTLAVHGSIGRDFDLIAIPWDEKITTQEILIKKMADASGGVVPKIRRSKEGDAKKNPTIRRHGRACWVILLANNIYLDINIAPSID